MNLQENIRKVLREESKLPIPIRRRLSLIDNLFEKFIKNIDFNEYDDVDDFHNAVVHEITDELCDDLETYNYYYGYLDDLLGYKILKVWKNRNKKNIQENIQRIKEVMGIITEDDIQYKDPNFDLEWQEAERYIEHPNPNKRISWSKEEWLEKVRSGKIMNFSDIDDLQNITGVEDFDDLVPEKIERFLDAYSRKVIELPIAVKLPNGTYDLIAGNTRLTGLRKHKHDPKIWVFEL